MSSIIESEDRFTPPVYAKLPVVVVKGRGAKVWDVHGRVYVDCMGGYGVALVGHCHPRVVEAVKRQVENLMVCHGSLYNDVRAEFLEKLISIAPRGLDMVYLGNSGAEAVEAALKVARKYTGRRKFVSAIEAYHGKTMGALSVTWRAKYRKPFEPLIGDVEFVPYGNAERLRKAVSKDTAAVILEPVQGEAGVKIPPEDYLKEAREICDERDALLIFDEIQCGLGRTGEMWACQHWNVTPDILCVAKGLAGGIPIGATIGRREVIGCFSTGEHTSTFGGNPVACAAGSAVIDVLLSENLPEKSKKVGSLFKSILEELASKYRIIRRVRGLGLMLAFDSRFSVKDIVFNAVQEGLLILYSGLSTVRLLPPLVISEDEVRSAVSILERLIAREEEKLNS